MKTIIANQHTVVHENAERKPTVRWALVSLSLSMLLSSLDTSIANVALPTLVRAFTASFQEVQWVILAYLLAATTLIVSVGRLGDIIGRRRLLLAGIFLYTVASVLCAVAPAFWVLIAGRAAQGLGGAIMMALSMAFVGETVSKAQDRERHGPARHDVCNRHRARSIARRRADRRIRLAGHLPHQPAAGDTDFSSRASLSSRGSPGAGDGSGRIRPCGHAPAGADARGLCPRRDDRSRQFRNPQSGAASGCGHWRRPLCARRGENRLAADPIDGVPRFHAECKPRHERTRHDRGDGDAGRRAVLSLSCARARCGDGGTRLIGRAAGRRADRGARRAAWRTSFGAPRVAIVGLIGMGTGSFILAMMPATLGISGYIVPIVVITAGYGLFQTANNTAVMTGISPDQRGVMSGMLNLSRNLGRITGASVMGAVFAFASATIDITTAPPEAVARGMRITFAVAAMLIVIALALAVGMYRRTAGNRGVATETEGQANENVSG